jgi:pimeloyl-ACP methyl ester carboxylesterase
VQVTTGAGIETYPAPLASGKFLATLSADWKMPQSVGIWTLGGAAAQAAAAQKIVFPASLKNFPTDLHVEPQLILTKAPDGLEIHNQLFLPKDLKPGERRAAIIFVHGGPARQMLLGYHYMQFYHWAYAINQWLASQGYIVMSVNYRLGIGYGRSFRAAANAGAAGNSEYQDVLAGAKYLQTRADVDPDRVGIWGLSYGGLLTAQALALYCLGIWPAAATRNCAAGFYSVGDTRTPAYVAIGTVGANIVINLVLMRHIGFLSFPLAAGVTQLANFGLLFWLLARRTGGLGGRSLLGLSLRALAAAALAGVSALACAWGWDRLVGPGGILGQAGQVFLAGGLGVVVYWLAGRLLGVKEIEQAARNLLRPRPQSSKPQSPNPNGGAD